MDICKELDSVYTWQLGTFDRGWVFEIDDVGCVWVEWDGVGLDELGEEGVGEFVVV